MRNEDCISGHGAIDSWSNDSMRLAQALRTTEKIRSKSTAYRVSSDLPYSTQRLRLGLRGESIGHYPFLKQDSQTETKMRCLRAGGVRIGYVAGLVRTASPLPTKGPEFMSLRVRYQQMAHI